MHRRQPIHRHSGRTSTPGMSTTPLSRAAPIPRPTSVLAPTPRRSRCSRPRRVRACRSAKSAAVTPAADQTAAKLGDSRIAYSYKLTNTGNVTLNTLLFRRPAPIGTVGCPAPCQRLGLQPGQSVTCPADTSHAVAQADVDAGNVKDTATAGCTDTRNDPCAVSTPSTAHSAGGPGERVGHDREARPGVPGGRSERAARSATTISYAYKVTNTGNVSLKTISVTDPTGGSVTCPSSRRSRARARRLADAHGRICRISSRSPTSIRGRSATQPPLHARMFRGTPVRVHSRPRC